MVVPAAAAVVEMVEEEPGALIVSGSVSGLGCGRRARQAEMKKLLIRKMAAASNGRHLVLSAARSLWSTKWRREPGLASQDRHLDGGRVAGNRGLCFSPSLGCWTVKVLRGDQFAFPCEGDEEVLMFSPLPHAPLRGQGERRFHLVWRSCLVSGPSLDWDSHRVAGW